MRHVHLSCLFDCFASQKHSVEEMWETNFRGGIFREIFRKERPEKIQATVALYDKKLT